MELTGSRSREAAEGTQQARAARLLGCPVERRVGRHWCSHSENTDSFLLFLRAESVHPFLEITRQRVIRSFLDFCEFTGDDF